jgi:hypothetical protein
VILAAEDTLDVSYLRASRRMAERMKSIVKSLNSELRPVIRFGFLEKSPLPVELIPEEPAPELPEAGVEKSVGPEEVPLNNKRVRDFNKEVNEVSRRLLGRILRSGSEGVSIEEISGELEEGEISPGVVKAAVQRLEKEDQVRKSSGRIFPAGAGVAGVRPKDVHIFEVKRVLPGKAVLSVDDRWYAVLLPEEYGGPRHLIRKGNRFRAAAELYRLDGKLHARIYAVEGTVE